MRIQKLMKLHQLLDKAGENGSDTGGTGSGSGGEGGAGNTGGEQGSGEGKGGTGGESGSGSGDSGNKGGDTKPSDAEAKLIKDVMKHKGRADELQKQIDELSSKLKAVEGIDLEKARKILAEQEELERKRAIEQGDFERLTKQMAEAHSKEKKDLENKLGESSNAITILQRQIADMTVGSAFTGSKFVLEELTLTPTKARVIYGAHFEFKDGAVVGYDKPAGASDRTVLVNATGEPLSFEEALKKIVDADPDKDHLIRSKQKPGAGSTSNPKAGKKAEQETKPLSSVDRIAAGLKTLANKK